MTSRLPDLSVVIPTLDAAATLRRTLEAVREAAGEIVIADGGSRDETQAIAADYGIRPIEAPRGRGRQLAAGADAANGGWLLFLHADSRPGTGWERAVAGFARRTAEADAAAAFRLRFDSRHPGARLVEFGAHLRCRWFGLPYGDQGLLIGRDFYRRLGGFRPLPLMEDVDLARRIGRSRLELLPVAMLTSAERYARDGWLRRPLRNLLLLRAFFGGTDPEILARRYAGTPPRDHRT